MSKIILPTDPTNTYISKVFPTSSRSNKSKNFIPALALCILSNAGATVVISDNFDNGSLATNPSGVGGGFVDYGQASSSESGGFANMNAGGGAATMVIQSAASFNPFQASPTVGVFSFGAMSVDSIHRQWVAYRLASNTGDHANPERSGQGLFISLLQNNGDEDRLSVLNGNLVAISDRGVRTNLATWNWSGSGSLDNLVMTLTTTATNYSLSFSGAGGRTPAYVTGSGSGTLSGIGTISSNFAVAIHNQYWNATGVPGAMTINSINVTIPEPSAMACITLALGGFVMLRSRRSA